MRRALRRGRAGEDGAAAVEFALVLPLLLLVVFGLVQYGFYFWSMQGGSAAARDAARRAAVGDPAACAGFVSTVRSSVAPIGDEDSLTVTRTYTKLAPPNVGIGDTVTVKVEFKSIDLNFPFVPFINDGIVSQTATSRVDYVPTQPETCT